MSSDAPPQIDYAPPVSARRRIVRRWTPRVLLLALLASAYFWGPPLWDRGQTLYWQRRCLTYRAPADAVVVRATFAPGGWASYDGPSVIPIEWTRFYRRVSSSPGLLSRGTVFLHELQSSGGERHLVGVDFIAGGLSSEPSSAGLSFYVRLMRLPGGARPAIAGRDQLARVRIKGVEPPAGRVDVMLFAGQPDDADPTHFTIHYRYGESEGIIDGWVRQSAVVLEPRDETRAVTPPPPTSAASPRAPAPPGTRPASRASRRRGG